MRQRQRVLIFANPIAGRGEGSSIAQRLRNRLQQNGLNAEIFFEPPNCFDLARLDQPIAAAVVIGGDGTLRAVAHRLFLDPCQPAQSARTAPPAEPPLLIVPLGTANLMGRHLGIRWDHQTLEDQVALAIARHRVVRLDTARANDRLFLLMAGVGFDAHIVHELDRLRRGPINIASYIAPALLALQNYRYPPLRVVVDSHDLFGPEPAVAFVGNLPEYGTGFPILPKARADDGVLDVCVLPCRNVQDLVRLFLMTASGEHLHAEGVVYAKGRHVRITADGGEVPVQVDGDPAGHAPVEIDLLPIRLPFMVPLDSPIPRP